MLTLYVPPLPPSKQNKMNGENNIMQYFNTFVYLLRQTFKHWQKTYHSARGSVAVSENCPVPQSLGVTR